jgi:hypothetical protein
VARRSAPNLEGLTEEQRAAIAELDSSAARAVRAAAAEQKERHDGGNRWIGTGGTSPFGHGGKHPTGMRVGGGGGRSAMAVADERRFKEYRTRRRARRPPDRRRAARAAPARPRGRAGGARPRRDRRRDLPQRGRDRGRVPAAAPQPREGRAADGRRRLDGSARRAGEPAVHRRVARGPVREVPQLLLPQLRLQLGLRGRPVPQGRAGRRPARDQRSRREARRRRRRPDAPGRAARSRRLDVPLLAAARVGHRVAAPAARTSAARRGSTPSPSGSGRARRSR